MHCLVEFRRKNSFRISESPRSLEVNNCTFQNSWHLLESFYCLRNRFRAQVEFYGFISNFLIISLFAKRRNEILLALRTMQADPYQEWNAIFWNIDVRSTWLAKSHEFWLFKRICLKSAPQQTALCWRKAFASKFSTPIAFAVGNAVQYIEAVPKLRQGYMKCKVVCAFKRLFLIGEDIESFKNRILSESIPIPFRQRRR